jgi:hypothetical protein
MQKKRLLLYWREAYHKAKGAAAIISLYQSQNIKIFVAGFQNIKNVHFMENGENDGEVGALSA